MAQAQSVQVNEQPQDPTPDPYRRLVDQFQRAFFEQHDAALAAQVYTEDATLLDPTAPGPIRGRKAIEANLAGYLRAFPDFSGRVENVIGSGEWFAAELNIRGTNTGPLEMAPGQTVPPTNKRCELAVCWVVRLSPDGRCIEDHTYYDVASMMEQLGLAG